MREGTSDGQQPGTPAGEQADGAREPAAPDPRSAPPGEEGRDPHHVLNNPVGEPDPTEWPDPYDRRPDPRFPARDPLAGEAEEVHTPEGALSTSEPHPDQDIEESRSQSLKRDKLDE